jgi:hypothetical protein
MTAGRLRGSATLTPIARPPSSKNAGASLCPRTENPPSWTSL